MTPLDFLGLFGILAGAAAVLATLFVKNRDKAVAANWKEIAESAQGRADEEKKVSASLKVVNDALLLRVTHLEQQVAVLVDTVTAKQSIDDLASRMDSRFVDLTALVVEAITTSGVPRAPSSTRRGA